MSKKTSKKTTIEILLEENSNLKLKNYMLKAENYRHMMEKIEMSDKINDLTNMLTAFQIGDNDRILLNKW